MFKFIKTSIPETKSLIFVCAKWHPAKFLVSLHHCIIIWWVIMLCTTVIWSKILLLSLIGYCVSCVDVEMIFHSFCINIYPDLENKCSVLITVEYVSRFMGIIWTNLVYCVGVLYILNLLPLVPDAEVERSEVYVVVIHCELSGFVSCLVFCIQSFFKQDTKNTTE
jgi:hypothetical protein